jgi:hypothetical protein
MLNDIKGIAALHNQSGRWLTLLVWDNDYVGTPEDLIDDICNGVDQPFCILPDGSAVNSAHFSMFVVGVTSEVAEQMRAESGAY